ncbi:hypothetical protein K9L05_01180 [Candidatus Babeliales bacterium]|nr:hypothetical protein [Candidatus Babeliales bacterium]MCF7899243.1 hypothetical protein [Candidatus Babeliales bacterium]
MTTFIKFLSIFIFSLFINFQSYSMQIEFNSGHENKNEISMPVGDNGTVGFKGNVGAHHGPLNRNPNGGPTSFNDLKDFGKQIEKHGIRPVAKTVKNFWHKMFGKKDKPKKTDTLTNTLTNISSQGVIPSTTPIAPIPPTIIPPISPIEVNDTTSHNNGYKEKISDQGTRKRPISKPELFHKKNLRYRNSYDDLDQRRVGNHEIPISIPKGFSKRSRDELFNSRSRDDIFSSKSRRDDIFNSKRPRDILFPSSDDGEKKDSEKSYLSSVSYNYLSDTEESIVEPITSTTSTISSTTTTTTTTTQPDSDSLIDEPLDFHYSGNYQEIPIESLVALPRDSEIISNNLSQIKTQLEYFNLEFPSDPQVQFFDHTITKFNELAATCNQAGDRAKAEMFVKVSDTLAILAKKTLCYSKAVLKGAGRGAIKSSNLYKQMVDRFVYNPAEAIKEAAQGVSKAVNDATIELGKVALDFFFNQERLADNMLHFADTTTTTGRLFWKRTAEMSPEQLIEKSVEFLTEGIINFTAPGAVLEAGRIVEVMPQITSIVSELKEIVRTEAAIAREFGRQIIPELIQATHPFQEALTGALGLGKIAIKDGVDVAKKTANTLKKNPGLVKQEEGIHGAIKSLSDMYKKISQGKGSTGRIIPNGLREQLAMKEVLSNPLEGARKLASVTMTDMRWPASEGWFKMSKNVNGIEIHYVYNTINKTFDDFKFK